MSNLSKDSPGATSPNGTISTNACPRLYQSELLEEAKHRNIIIRADTGTGKTLVAVLLIKWMATQPKAQGQRHRLQAFLVPTRPLVEQQSRAIRAETDLRVREYTGDLQPELWKVDKWHADLLETDVIVCTAQIFYDILSKGFWSLEDVSLLVFDEAHHCRKSHVYNQIMQVHFQRLAQDPEGRRVPKILGLTASPIWDCKSLIRAEKEIRALQTALSAQVYEIKKSREDLEKFTSKPKERIIKYEPVSIDDDTISKSYWDPVRPFVTAHADAKFRASFKTIEEELGIFAQLLYVSDWLSSLLSMSISKHSKAPRLLEPSYRLKIEEAIQCLNSLVDTDDIPTEQMTPKFQALLNVLLEYKKSDSESTFHGMIFVERRAHAQLLHRLISHSAALKGFIKSDVLTGHASHDLSTGRDHGMDFKSQNRTVDRFRAGEINLAVATSVAEEGLDFRACRVVLRFDDIKTWKGYIQSRGRARAADPDYIVMVPEGTDSKYLQFLGKEAELKSNLYGRPDDEEISDAELESTPQLINSLGEGKDAILTYSSAVNLLNEVCQLLQHDEYAPVPRPEFEDVTRLGGFVARVILPAMPALPPANRVFESDLCPNKKEAKRSACFKACHALRAAGVLNEHFMAQRERHIVGIIDADGRALDPSIVPERVDMICPNPFGDMQTSDIWLHKLSFDLLQSSSSTTSAPSSFGFLCGQRLNLPEGLVIYDHSQDGKALPVAIKESVKMGWSPEERAKNLERLKLFNLLGIQAAVNRRPFEGNLLFFLAVLVKDTMEIDWDLIARPLAPITSSGEMRNYKKSALIVPLRCLHHRVFTSYEYCYDLTADSKPNQVPAHPHLERFMRNSTKFKSLGHFQSVMSEEMRGQSHSAMVYVESDFKSEDNLLKSVDQSDFVPFRVIIPLSVCKGSRLPFYFWRIFSFVPALVRKIHDGVQVRSLLERLGVPHVSLDLAIEAMTQPGVGIEWDYQTLETVGDAFLKMATSVHVYLTHVKKGEGDMSALRSKSVDNDYLRHKSIQAGLGGYVLSQRYRTDRFRAPHMEEGKVLANGQFQRKIARRVLSDVVEALLGAGYLSCGIETALKIGTELDLCFGGFVPWSQRPCNLIFHSKQEGEKPHTLTASQSALQAAIGYEFKEPLLLVQALTHRSSGSFLTNCYEREEWLGDAIVDLWITEYCYRTFKGPTAAQLTFTRASLVANASLGYLALKKLGLDRLIIHGSSHFEKACVEALQEISHFESIGSFYEDLTNSFVVFDPPKILGDALEAIVGAMLIDCEFDLKVVFKSLERIYEDVLPQIKQGEPRDPLSRLLKIRDIYSCSELHRAGRHVVERDEKDDENCHSYRICEISLHGKKIASGTHPTSSTVADQRACLQACELLGKGLVPKEEDPWSVCQCKELSKPNRVTEESKPSDGDGGGDDDGVGDEAGQDGLLSSLSGKKNKRKRLQLNRRMQMQKDALQKLEEVQDKENVEEEAGERLLPAGGPVVPDGGNEMEIEDSDSSEIEFLGSNHPENTVKSKNAMLGGVGSSSKMQLDGDSSTQSTSKKKVKEDEQGNGVITEAIKKRSEEYLNGILKEVVASSKKSRR